MYVQMCVDVSVWIMCLYVNVSVCITYTYAYITLHTYVFFIINNPNPWVKKIVPPHRVVTRFK